MSEIRLILRTEPGASATAARVRAAGGEAVVAPIFTLHGVEWHAPDPAGFDALVLTSAQSVRLGGAQLARFHTLPVYAVGEATAKAARAAGFADVRAGPGDAADLHALAVADGRSCLLHLAGREHRALPEAETRIVYAADPVDVLPMPAAAALLEGAVVLLHSPRAAALFRALLIDAGLHPPDAAIAAISPAALQAAGEGWRCAVAADTPTDAALLAAARLCDHS